MNIKKLGIYALLNTVDGKRHIGQLNCKSFQRAFAKDGKRSFRLIALEVCSLEKLVERERYWVDHYREDKGAYNAAPVAELPAETKKKTAIWNKPKPYKNPQPRKDD